MATHTCVFATSPTLVANTIDLVTASLTNPAMVTVLKRSTGGEIRFTVGSGTTPPDPTINSANDPDCYPMADVITSMTVPCGPGLCEVKVLSTAAVEYSVIVTQ